MNTTAMQLLDRFDQLPRNDQQDVAREILRRTVEFDVPPLSDEELVEQADALFLKLDEAEATDAQES
jgi:predicted HAD superfamily phosphohydrolase